MEVIANITLTDNYPGCSINYYGSLVQRIHFKKTKNRLTIRWAIELEFLKICSKIAADFLLWLVSISAID